MLSAVPSDEPSSTTTTSTFVCVCRNALSIARDRQYRRLNVGITTLTRSPNLPIGRLPATAGSHPGGVPVGARLVLPRDTPAMSALELHGSPDEARPGVRQERLGEGWSAGCFSERNGKAGSRRLHLSAGGARIRTHQRGCAVAGGEGIDPGVKRAIGGGPAEQGRSVVGLRRQGHRVRGAEEQEEDGKQPPHRRARRRANPYGSSLGVGRVSAWRVFPAYAFVARNAMTPGFIRNPLTVDAPISSIRQGSGRHPEALTCGHGKGERPAGRADPGASCSRTPPPRYPAPTWCAKRAGARSSRAAMDLQPSARQQRADRHSPAGSRASASRLARSATIARRPSRSTTTPICGPRPPRPLRPQRYGGLGADYETYCLVAEQLAQGNASTALTFNMHCLTMLMMGVLADDMPMSAAARGRHEKLRARQVPRGDRGRRLLRPAPQRAGGAGRDGHRAAAWAAAASAPPPARWTAATWSTAGSSSSPSPAPRPISPRPPSGWATSPGSSARSISRSRRTRPACPFPATGIRWACAARSAATWCSRTSSSRTTARSCRRASSAPCTTPSPSSRR